MAKTSNHDMEDIQSWVYAHERAHPGDIGHKVGNAIMELLALREVAAAARVVYAAPGSKMDAAVTALGDALKKAGL